ncbi:hypothetical protein SAMN05421786_11555 [Chryseobacterium ureilyticum]|uniref:Uncharacterized protein n=1 Tax=Chryseobacterium ureilyticum TaxID=373668 RepID=A0A1N7QSD3_9FLAO|nr:SGNH/GDSL hydrolase family protein [Chryseobacterium ureilyticum]SIT25679.1 hypothetical protein SAMN05421786_11555 [Chryseobacterium ureilyticum]
MPKISKINLRQLFAKGMKPSQEAFYNLFDSFWHKDDQIDIAAVKDLQLSLNSKLDNAAKDSLLDAFNDALTDIHQAVESEFKGILNPTGMAPTEDGSYKPAVSSELDKPTDPTSTLDWGTKYPNAGNLRSKQGYSTMFYKKGTVWTKSETKIDVNSEKYDKTSAAVGNYPDFANPNKMTLPNAGFTLEQGNNTLPATLRYWQSPALLKDRYIVKIRAKATAIGNVNIFIHKKSDMSLDRTIQVNVTSQIFEYVFTEPIDSDLYYVMFSSGIMYYAFNGGTPVKQMLVATGEWSENPTIALCVEYFTYHSAILPKTLTVAQRLDLLESRETKSFQWSNIMLDKTELLSKIVKESINSVFTIDSGIINITSIGDGLGIVVANNIYLNKRCFEFDVKLSDINTKMYFGTKPTENQVGSATYSVDFSTKKINNTFDFSTLIDVNINDSYSISMSYKISETTIRIRNKRTTQEALYTFKPTTDEFDQYKVGFMSGGGSISKMKIYSMAKERPYIMFFGDSIMRGSNNNPLNKRFADLCGTFLGKEYLISGRAVGNIDGLMNRLAIEIPCFRPRYVCITIGTNGGNTEAKLNAMIDFCEGYGCTVILNHIPLYDSSTAAKNAMIANVVNSRKLMSIRYDIATSIGFDATTKDNSCFSNESGIFIHPNEKGNQQIFDRSKIDMEEVFINAGAA